MDVDPNDRESPLDPPIEEIVFELAAAPRPPANAIGACLRRYPEAGPLLLESLIRAADGVEPEEVDATLVFRALHIIGAQRDPRAFAPLLRLLRLPFDDVDFLLGDAVTEILPRIAAGVFDGDTSALFTTITDLRVNEYIRDGLLGAATFLTWEGRIQRMEMAWFLERFHRDRLAPSADASWYGWQRAIALLGLRDLAPAVASAFRDGTIPEEFVEYREFVADLERAEREPGNIGRFEGHHLGYVGDVLESLEKFNTSYEETPDTLPSWLNDGDLFGEGMPAVNPFRHVGRNDPCPCGSGKKAKRCCLAA